jgi:hypothetical protein
MYRYKQKKEKKYFSMKYLKRFNESNQTQPKITEDMIEDIKDIFFNCFSEEFDSHKFEWWSDDLRELDEDVFYIEIYSKTWNEEYQKYWTVDLIVNSLYQQEKPIKKNRELYNNDPFANKEGLSKFERFKKILKDEYDYLNFSDNIDWDSTAALQGSYQEFFYTTYTIL